MSGTSELSPYFIERTRAHDRLIVHSPSTRPAANEEFDLREYWRVIRRHLALIMAVVTSAILLAGVVIFTITPVYTASAVILINPQPPQVLDIKQLTVQPTAGEEQDYYKTQYALLRSRSLAAKVIHDLGLENNQLLTGAGSQGLLVGVWTALRQAIDALGDGAHDVRGSAGGDGYGISAQAINAYLSRLNIEPEFGTRLVKIAFSTPYPSLSATVANAHARAYVRQGMDLRARASESAERFLEGKLVELGDRVEKSEAALNSYRHDKGIVEFSTNGKNEILLKRLEDLNAALTKAETARIALEAQADLIRKGDYYSLPGVVTSPMVQALKPQLAELEAKYASMSDRYTLAYGPMAALKAKLDDARAQLNQTVDQIVQSVQLRYQAAVDRQQQLAKEVEQEKARALALNDASLKDAILAREVDTNRQLYESVLKRMKEMGVAAAVRASNVSIVDPATPPPYPSSPRKTLIMALSVIFGFGTALAAAFTLEYLDDGLKTPEQVERLLRLPSLAFVPDMQALANGGARRELGSGVGLSGVPAAHGVTHTKNGREAIRVRSVLASALEAYRTIRSQVLLSRAGNPPRTVLVTSALPGEGKSITAVNTAIIFAQNGRRIVLVDADLRRARCHELLRCEGHQGLSEVLSGQAELDDVISATAVGNLDFLSAGAVPPDPAELLGSVRMDELLAQLCARYQHVIIDSAPVIPISDSVVLSQHVDGVIMVVGRATSKQVVKRACLRMSDAGAKLLGAVLNRISAHHASYYSYGNYQYYPYRERDGGASAESHVKIVFD
jgi:capsular exopolysaccharide synthesis family protein